MSKDTNACQINVLTGLVFTPGSILNQLPQLHGDPMTNPRDDGDAVALIGRLRARTITSLPRDWYKGRKCPERGCLASAERPKCFFELGGACPRLDPDAYDKSPYVETPDQDCVAAADLIATLSHITKPKRVQRKRTKGWRMPPNTVSVTRPGRHGNPFQVVRLHGANGPRGEEWIVIDTRTDAWAISATFPNSALAATYAVDCFRREAEPRATEIQRDLKGRNLACYCGLDQPCHGDVLLELANAPTEGTP